MTRPSDEERRREKGGGSGDAPVQPRNTPELTPHQQDEALEDLPRAEEPPPAPEAAPPANLRAKDGLKQVGIWPEEEIAHWSDGEVLIAEQILAGDAEGLQRAFKDAPNTTWLKIRAAKLPWEVHERLHRTLTRMLLAAELQPQAPAARGRLELRLAWTWLESELKSEALVALLDEVQAHGHENRLGRIMDVLRSCSSDQLGRFLQQAAGRGRAAWEVFVWGMENVQLRGDPIPFSQLAQLLIDVRVEQWVKKRLAGILWARASSTTVKADLAEMVAELVQGASSAEVEELSRRVYMPVLIEERYPPLGSRKATTEWLLAHLSAVKGYPSASDLYLCIVRDSKYLSLSGLVSEEQVKDYRVQALRCLAELALIVPLEHIKEIKSELREHLSNPDEAVREATIDALVPIQRRLREAQAEVAVERSRDGAPSESATPLSAPEWTSWPTPPGEAIIRFATSPRFPPLISLPIQDSLTISLTISLGSGPISPVARMDASQGGLGPAAAPPPDLDLSSYRIAVKSGGDGFTPSRCTAAIEVPADPSELAVLREWLDGASDFARSTEMNREARRVFQEELADLAGRVFPRDRLEELISRINQQCERVSSVLREPGGQFVTLRLDGAGGQVEMIPLHAPETVIRCGSLPVLEVVPVEGLPDRDRAILFGRRGGSFLSRLRAESMSEEERQQIARHAAMELNQQMTPEQRRERASKGAKKLNETSTAEERSERARRAVQARWARKRGETNQ